MKQQLRQQTTITSPFRINTDLQSCKSLIDYHYQVEVWKRHKDFVRTAKYDKMITEFCQNITSTDMSTFGIVLFGLYGNGKTTLLNAFDEAVRHLDKNYNAFSDDMAVTHKRYDPIVMDAKTLARQCAKDEDTYIKTIDSNILCVDDVGTEPREVLVYGTPYAPVADMLEYRYSKQLFTIVTTNLKPAEFFDKYGGRVKDRLPDMMTRIVSENESYRAKWL